MDYNQMMQAIGTVGFPIVAFIMMYYFATNAVQKNTEAIDRLKDALISLLNK